MPESQGDPFPPRGSFRRRVEDLRMKAEMKKFDLEHSTADLKYKITLPKEKRERASQAAEAFTGEFMDYLSEDTTTKLASFHPSPLQLECLQFILESIEDGSLMLKQTEGQFGDAIPGGMTREYIDKPIVCKIYRAERNPLSNLLDLSTLLEFTHAPRDEQVQFFADSRRASVVTRYVVNDDFPESVIIHSRFGQLNTTGEVRSEYPGRINFIFFPSKPESPEEVIKQRGILPNDNGWQNSIGVYGNGERIDFSSEGVDGKENVATTVQYHLIGSFDGEKTGKTYWVYGSNEDLHQKETVSERATARQPVVRPVTNG